MEYKTRCGLEIPRVDQLRCLDERSIMVTTYNDTQSSSVYLLDRDLRTAGVFQARDLADRVTEAQRYWFIWHNQYCDCMKNEES